MLQSANYWKADSMKEDEKNKWMRKILKEKLNAKQVLLKTDQQCKGSSDLIDSKFMEDFYALERVYTYFGGKISAGDYK